MPDPTDTDTVVSASTTPPGAAAVTVTVRTDTPSPIESWSPFVSGSASTDRSMVPLPVMVRDADPTVNPDAEPVIDNASASATTLSVWVVNVKAPDADDAPAAITASNDSSPSGIT